MSVRIRGLVKAARVCRESLARGVPSGERADFLAWVRGILGQVEEFCRELPGGVEGLPRPSLEAYRFLLKVAREGASAFASPRPAGPSRPAVRAPGLVAFLEEMLLDLGTPGEPSFSVEEYRRRASERVEAIRKGLARKGLDPSFLPQRTGMAFAWLDWLAREDHLEVYRGGLDRFRTGLSRVSRVRWGRSPDRMGVLFLPSRCIYRVKEEKGILVWRLHCGFLEAEAPEIEGFFRALLPGRKRDGSGVSQAYKEFVSSRRFFSLSREMEDLVSGKGRDFPRGRAWDLELLFEKINQEYFQGGLARPRLSWGDRITRRKLGSYDRQRNRITLSPLLDDPGLPECVPAYVLYHEMLHLERPGRVVGGRHVSHDTWFKGREARFKQRKEALRFLRGIWGKEAGAGG